MTAQQSVGRRTALKTFCAAGVVATGATGVSVGRRTEHSESAAQSEQRESTTEESSQTESTSRTGFYNGTVDRIVDGEHVVILVESDGRVIDQHIVSAESYPMLGEGDAVGLFIMFGSIISVWPA